jgi:hypothetical protein
MNSVKRFIQASKSFKSSDQMQTLIRTHFFSKKDLREGLKRWIHIQYIDFQ